MNKKLSLFLILGIFFLFIISLTSAKLTSRTSQVNCLDIFGGSDSNFCVDAVGGGIGDEVDPYWTGNQSLYTLLSTLNNGSYFNGASSEPNWNANYSTFLTHATISYVDIQNTSQTNWVNTIFVKIADLVSMVGNWSSDKPNYVGWAGIGNGTFILGSNWNTTNTSYALISNLENGSYFNIPETDPKWTANQSLYTLLTTINNGTYTNTDTFVANYSTFLTHVTYPQVMNGTLTNKIWTDLANGTMVAYSTLNNGSYFNGGTGATWLELGNGTVVYLTTLNNGTYFRTNQFNATNTSYYLGTNPSNYINWATAMNGTLALMNNLTNLVNWANVNNGTIVDVNKVSWLNIGNGTLPTTNATWTQVGNGTMAKSSELNNGSYFNVAGGSYPYTNVTKANITSIINTGYNANVFLIPLTANNNYSINCYFNTYTNVSTVGVQYNISAPNGFRFYSGAWTQYTTATAPLINDCSSTTNSSCLGLNTAGLVAGLPAFFDGYVEVGTAGNLNVSMKRETTGAIVTTSKGSWCRLTNVDLGAV